MQSICVNYIACVSLNTNRRKNIFHTRHVGLWQNNKLKSLKVAQSKDDNYGWMMIFILDNIACLDEWVVSGGGVDVVVGVIDGCRCC